MTHLPLHKISARNTQVSFEPHDGVIVVKYYNTEIIRASRRDENVKVSTGGWADNGMLTRINQALKVFGLDYRIRYQINRKKDCAELAIYDTVDKRPIMTAELFDTCVDLYATLSLPASVV